MCNALTILAIALLAGAIGLLWILHNTGGVLKQQDERERD
jgi:cell division protein FtsL